MKCPHRLFWRNLATAFLGRKEANRAESRVEWLRLTWYEWERKWYRVPLVRPSRGRALRLCVNAVVTPCMPKFSPTSLAVLLLHWRHTTISSLKHSYGGTLTLRAVLLVTCYIPNFFPPQCLRFYQSSLTVLMSASSVPSIIRSRGQTPPSRRYHLSPGCAGATSDKSWKRIGPCCYW